MKTLSCDICDQTFSADDFDGWFAQMMTHYMADHADIMAASKDKSKEDGEKWMAANRKRFEES